MKKRFMNALLLGALVFASTSTFVSCKDYDDDITNLQTQIDKLNAAAALKTDVEQLRTAVDAAKAEALAKAQDALDKANAAQTANAATKEELAKVKETAEKAQTAAEKAQTDLAAAKADLEALIASKADQADLDKANEKIAAAELAIAENKALAEAAQALAESKTDAASALAAAKAEVEAAKDALKELINAKADATTVTDATDRVEKLEDFIGSIEENKTLKDVVDAAVAAAIGETTSDASLASKIAKLEAAVFAKTEEGLVSNITLLQNELKTLQAEAEELQIAYSTMITSVDLFANDHSHGWGIADCTKEFTSVMEKTNVFEAPDGQKIEFTEGRYSVYGDSVIIRVNPVNAKLTPDMVTMLNSQNGEIPGLVIEDVKPYKGLLTANTRAASDNNGLWVVKFNLDKDYDAEAVDAAFYADAKNKKEQILYAVAVTPKQANTLTEKVEEGQEAAQRRLVSDYDLRFSVADGTKAKDFTVHTMDQIKGISEIRNRFYNTEEGINTEKREDLVWARNDADKGIVTPTVAATADNTVKKADQKYGYGYWPVNSKNDDGYVLMSDNRNWCSLLISEVGEDIVIDYSYLEKQPYQAYGQRVAGFYVSLDKSHAIESKPSEIEAWTNYEYEGLDKLFLGNKGTIKVTSPAAHGDVIGFRVFAVNLDGTLVDPDGRAFYVQLGDADKQELGAFDAKFDVKDGIFTTGLVEVDNDKFTFEDYMNVYMSLYNNTPDADNQKPLPNIKFYGADKKTVLAEWKWNYNGEDRYLDVKESEKIKYIEIVIPNDRATQFIDGATYTYELNIHKSNNASTLLRTLTMTMKKVMPEAPGFAYLDAQDENQWVIPGDGSVVPSLDSYKIKTDEDIDEKSAYIDLFNVLSVPHLAYPAKIWHNETQFMITVANSQYKLNDESEYVVAPSEKIEWDPAGINRLNIMNSVITGQKEGKNVYAANLVDNTTAHAFAAKYNFGKISKHKNENGDYIPDYYAPDVTSVPKAVVFCSWTKNFSYDAASKKDGQTEKNKWWQNNTVTWKSTNPGEGDAAILNLGNVPTKIEGRVNENIKPNANTLGGLLVGNFLTVVDNKVSVETTNGASPYFTASYDGEYIKVTQKTDSQKPIKHEETLKFTVEDCFGNQIPVSLTIQVTVVD